MPNPAENQPANKMINVLQDMRLATGQYALMVTKNLSWEDSRLVQVRADELRDCIWSFRSEITRAIYELEAGRDDG